MGGSSKKNSIDNGCSLFIVIFSSKSCRDKIHKHKGWFCERFGLFTFLWGPNFDTSKIILKYAPFWIQFPSLALEYRDLDLIYMFANHLGIFIKHDLVPFEQIGLPTRVCLFLYLSKLFTERLEIASKYGVWVQIVELVHPKDVVGFINHLGHFSTSLCGQSDRTSQSM